MVGAALDNWQPLWNARVSISTFTCVNFELHPGFGDEHIGWFNFIKLKIVSDFGKNYSLKSHFLTDHIRLVPTESVTTDCSPFSTV